MSATPTVLPFRSTTLRIDSCANSSKQAGCTPASMTAGTPASIERIVVAAKSWAKSASPRATALGRECPNLRLSRSGRRRTPRRAGDRRGCQAAQRKSVVLAVQEPHRGRLRRRLFRQRSASARERRGPGEACGRDEKPVLRKCRRFCMFASPLLREGVFARGDHGRILIRGPNVANGSLPAFPSVFASIGRLDATDNTTSMTVGC